MKVVLAKSYGFCQGVKRAIQLAEEATRSEKKLTVFKEIVHNPTVIADLAKKGIKFEEDLKKIKKGTIIFSAHGVAPEVRSEAEKRDLKIIDATCPLVAKVHALVKSFVKKGYEIIYIGDKGHDEVIGVLGEAPRKIKLIFTPKEAKTIKVKNPKKIVILTQTTLSIFDTSQIIKILKKRFPQALVFDTICKATTERQKAVKDLAKKTNLVIVVGGKNSANSQRLKEIAQKADKPAYSVENVGELDKSWFSGVKTIGITAGASTPDKVTRAVVMRIKSL